jgi:hypothetical protein
VKVYHRTLQLDERSHRGSGEGRGGVMTDELLVGVWVSTTPPGTRGADTAGEVVEFEIPDSLFERYEWVEEDRPFREALIPAPVLQRFGRPWIEPDDVVAADRPSGGAASATEERDERRTSDALKAVLAVSAVFVLHRAWKRRQRSNL